MNGYTAKMAYDASFIERFILAFVPFLVHKSEEGFVIYKMFRKTVYVYVNGHYVNAMNSPQAEWTNGAEKPWSN